MSSAYSRQIQVVKDLAAVPPHICIAVLLLTFVWDARPVNIQTRRLLEGRRTVEAIYLGDLTRLVVAPYQRYAIGISERAEAQLYNYKMM